MPGPPPGPVGAADFAGRRPAGSPGRPTPPGGCQRPPPCRGDPPSRDLGLKGKLALADGFAIGTFLMPTLRFPVLAYWSFTCEERGDFQYLATNVHVRMLGHVVQGAETPDGDPSARAPAAPGNAAQPGVTRPLPLVAETGHVRLDHVSRAGEAAPAWFRGRSSRPPCRARRPPVRAEPGIPPPPLAHHADQLRRVVPDGREDLGYAAAFEIGRLLALSQPGVVAALARWRQEAFGAARVSTVAGSATTDLPDGVQDAAGRPDPLVDPKAALQASTVGARMARALVETLGEGSSALLGAPRPVADPGVATVRLDRWLGGGRGRLMAGFGLAGADAEDPQDVLDAVRAAPVRVVAEQGGEVQTSALRARLEEDVAAVATDAAARTPGPAGFGTGIAPSADTGDALDALLRRRAAAVTTDDDESELS